MRGKLIIVCLFSYLVMVAANPALIIVFNLLRPILTRVAVNCIRQAAQHCQGNFRNPPAAIRCGRSFIARNRGRCALPG